MHVNRFIAGLVLAISRLNVAEDLLVKAKSKSSLKKVCSLSCLQYESQH